MSTYYKTAGVHYNAAVHRDITLLQNGLQLGSGSAGNEYIVPYYIWGIKGQLTID